MADEVQVQQNAPVSPEVPETIESSAPTEPVVVDQSAPIGEPVVESSPVSPEISTEVVEVDGEEFVKVVAGSSVVLIRL